MKPGLESSKCRARGTTGFGCTSFYRQAHLSASRGLKATQRRRIRPCSGALCSRIADHAAVPNLSRPTGTGCADASWHVKHTVVVHLDGLPLAFRMPLQRW